MLLSRALCTAYKSSSLGNARAQKLRKRRLDIRLERLADFSFFVGISSKITKMIDDRLVCSQLVLIREVFREKQQRSKFFLFMTFKIAFERNFVIFPELRLGEKVKQPHLNKKRTRTGLLKGV